MPVTHEVAGSSPVVPASFFNLDFPLLHESISTQENPLDLRIVGGRQNFGRNFGDDLLESISFHKRNETFSDVAPKYGMASDSLLMTGKGGKFFDYDNDGNEDLIIGNGHPEPNVAEMFPGLTYDEPMMLYRNTHHGFKNVGKRSGPIF